MRKIILGINYKFEISIHFKENIFEIYAKHLISNRVSPITNVNAIISTFYDFLSDSDKFEDNTWEIKNRVNLLTIWKNSIEFFTDINYIAFIEKELNKDVFEGGWNSYYDF